MDMYPKYKSPLGYSTGDNNIDAYGVDHSGFSNRDEIEYQIARGARENQIIQNYNNQGITENYPQYTTNFWGSSPENNYGFGTSKIHNNIENMQNQTNFGNSNNTQWGMNNEQSQVYNPLGNSNSTFNSGLNNSSLLSTNNMQGLNLNASAALYPQQNSFSTYSQPYQLAQNSLPNSGSDVGNMSTGNFSPEVLKERMLPVIKNMEKPLDYIYIDTTWNKTTGAGANVDDWDTFNQINWEINGRPATEAEKRAVFNIFQNEINQGRQNKDSKGNIIKNNRKASSYIGYSQLQLAKGETDRLLRNHITEDIKYLQKEFPDFASYPPELQNVLLDIKFNTGNVSQENWPKLRKAIAEKNLFGKDGIIYNVHRKDVGEDRNYWTEQQIRNIKSW